MADTSLRTLSESERVVEVRAQDGSRRGFRERLCPGSPGVFLPVSSGEAPEARDAT